MHACATAAVVAAPTLGPTARVIERVAPPQGPASALRSLPLAPEPPPPR
ncbi:MAG: hypothetical protein HY275_09620 [Gemmatimonadetes bacterium]|nr:hypothetical protein [Gemmatimonadota bacterium]